MKTIRDWFSCQLVPKSLLSVRPLNFSSDEPPGESNQGTNLAAIPEQAFPNSSQSMNSNQIYNASPCPQFTTAEVSHPPSSTTRTNNGKDPLTKVEGLLVNYLRFILRFNLPLNNIVVTQVLYRLHLASLIQNNGVNIKGTGLNVDKARVLAAEKEASDQTDLDFSLKILVLGKTGVGKSATINSIFNQKYAATNSFQPSTGRIEEVTGILKGIRITVIDTPGLSPSYTNQRHNRKILHAVKRFIKKSPPDLVLYVERLDVIDMGYSDFPLLKLVTDVFGSSVWFNTILVMTHCSSALPEGPDGYPINYESYVKRCTNLVQHYIHQVVSDTKLEVPVLLVENHPMCMMNREGEKILPNGEAWRHKFFLLAMSTKTLADANRVLKFGDGLPRAQIGTRSPSLPHLLSMLLNPRSLRGSGDDENELDQLIDLDHDDEEYEKLPPIRILTKDQFQRLTKPQKSDYLDELDYRETLYLKKQLKEELKRWKENPVSVHESSETYEEETNDSYDATPLPDMAVPVTFDSEYPIHRYRSPVYTNQYIVRPVLDSEGWDHDISFDGINLESSIEFKKHFNTSVIGQMSKDKDEFNLQAELLTRYRDPRGSSLSTGVNLQTSKKDLIYTITGDMKFRCSKRNTTGAVLSVTSFRDMYLPGIKFEDLLTLGSRLGVRFNAGTLYGNGQVAHGGGVQAMIRGADYPVRDERLTVGANIIYHNKEMVLGGNIESSFRAGRGMKVSTDVNLNSRKMGHISIKTSTSEHIELALVAAVISIVRAALFRDKSH